MSEYRDKMAGQLVGSNRSSVVLRGTKWSEDRQKLSSSTALVPASDKRSDLEKIALGTGGGMSGPGAVDATNLDAIQGAEVFLSQTDSTIPRHRRFLFYFCLSFYKQHALVRNTVDIHAQNMYSKIQLSGINDKKIKNVYEDAINEVNLQDILYPMIFNYMLFGEDITVAQFDEAKGMFDKVTIRFPHSFSVIPQKILIDGELPEYHYKYIYNDTMYNDFIDRELANVVGDPLFAGLIRIGEGEAYEINNLNVWHTKGNPAFPRGYPDLEAAINFLVHERLLLTANYRVARDRIKLPNLYRVGSMQYELWPNEMDIRYVRNLLQKVATDPATLAVVTPDIEYVGGSGELRLLDIHKDLELCRHRILTALWSPIDSENPDQRQGYIGGANMQTVAQNRYIKRRGDVERTLKNSFFKTIAAKHGFYRRSGAEISGSVRLPKTEDDLVLPDKILSPDLYTGEKSSEYSEVMDIANEIFAMEEIDKISPRLDLVVKTAKVADFIVPEIKWDNKIRVTDSTEKLNFLLQLSKEDSSPNVYRMIFDELGYDYDEMMIDTWESVLSTKDPAMLKLYRSDPKNFWAEFINISGSFPRTTADIENSISKIFEKDEEAGTEEAPGEVPPAGAPPMGGEPGAPPMGGEAPAGEEPPTEEPPGGGGSIRGTEV